MSKHTPGPWTHYDDTTPAGKTGRHEIVATGRTVARIYYADERAPYDARLIAAAPDLLSALQEIVARNEIQHWFNLDQARAAIARATGNPPSD